MSNEITTSRVQKYFDGITILAQQRMSRLRSKVRSESGVIGKAAYFDQIGATIMQKKSGRHTDTPLIEIPHRRRQVQMDFYHTADLVDVADVLTIINDPTNSYGMTMAMAAGRQIDAVIAAQFFATANTGEAGETPTSFPAAFIVDSAGNAAMTTAKVIEAKEILDANENDPQIMRHAGTTAKQVSDLLQETSGGTVTNSDYNTVKALVRGEINSWVGFDWMRYEEFPETGDPYRRCPFWSERSMLLGIGQDIRGRISERDDKDYSTQVYYSLRIGATRMDETGVVEVRCDEA